MSDSTKRIYFVRLPGEWPWLNKIITEAKKPTKIKNGWMTAKNGMPVTGIAYKTLKAKTEKKMIPFFNRWLGSYKATGNTFFYIRIYAKNRMKDPNNLKVVDKFICDLLQSMEFVPNDGWDNMSEGFMTKFFIDKKNPRVDIWILENYEVDLPIDHSAVRNADETYFSIIKNEGL